MRKFTQARSHQAHVKQSKKVFFNSISPSLLP
jgi:hypothetical protein